MASSPASDAAKRPGAARSLSLKGRALRYLSAREHSRAELQTKLARYAAEAGEDAQAVARVLDELTAKGFISEARVAESVVHRRAGRLGNARVLQELRAKGLPDDIVQGAAEQLRATEDERAYAVWARKFGRPPADLAERARQMRFLAGRGFSGASVARVMRTATRGADERSDPFAADLE
ncbi:recombination regulator RecX [Ottowia sp. GY511]|uniref:Regulatory protein RecX n=1 Tax=Ottowia flava TaxID=2675430 RepID=A0ABW4KV93_9BURK|nr:recombination regulator RecX [Ottowia sp. GY511]TXK27088.1 recombination regulator RecX [Ottowia sp. GY511]